MPLLLVQAINGIVSRRIDPMKSAVISVGIVQTGTAFNIIPNEVYIGGTIRSFDPEVREQLYVELDRAFSVAKALGGDYTLEIIRGYPAGINDATVTQWMDDVATEYLGSANVDRVTAGMGGEDFAYMQQKAPGTMMMLGAALGDMNRPHHTPVFDIDERSFPIGAAILAETVRRYLTRA